ncbi:MAG TPA: hypothetical protein DIT10_17065 [Chryseobacterium sp.]|nr:hypothetical protein [Chryseobacterium sp.]
MMETKNSAKKRMMFIQKEDYNFLTYNILFILKYFNATSEESKFKDFRKIAYMVHFISFNYDFKLYEKNELILIYSKAQLKKQLISHLLVILKNKGYIGVSVNMRHQSFDLWLKEENIPEAFFDENLFQNEVTNIKNLKKIISHLKIITVKKLVDVIFTSRNITTWEI